MRLDTARKLKARLCALVAALVLAHSGQGAHAALSGTLRQGLAEGLMGRMSAPGPAEGLDIGPAAELLGGIPPLGADKDESAIKEALKDSVTATPAFGPQASGAAPEKKDQAYAGQNAGAAGNYDFYGSRSFRSAKVLGFDFSGYAKKSASDGEFTFADEAPDYIRSVLGFDYSFPSTLYVIVEYLYDEGEIKGMLGPVDGKNTSEIIVRGRNFIGTGLGYSFGDILRLELLTIVDIEDKSAFLGPSLTYNLLEDIDLTAGIQVFSGNEKNEYGGLSGLYYAELKLFF